MRFLECCPRSRSERSTSSFAFQMPPEMPPKIIRCALGVRSLSEISLLVSLRPNLTYSAKYRC